jgi:hypothetical protein
MATESTPATVHRFDEEGDWIVKQMFSAADLALSPEEYAARHAHEWACFAFHRYRFQDPLLGAWVRRLGEILDSESEVERCQQRFLTAEEMAEVQRQQAEGF